MIEFTYVPPLTSSEEESHEIFFKTFEGALNYYDLSGLNLSDRCKLQSLAADIWQAAFERAAVVLKADNK
jgi:hypothetical protein